MKRRLALGCAVAAATAWLTGCDAPTAQPAKQRWPALAVRELSGRPAHMESKGTTHRLVNFWALWCPPCRRELPSLERLAGARALAVEVCAVAIAEDGFAVREYLAQHAAGLPCVVLRPGDPALRQLDVTVLPQTFLVSAGGEVLARWVGERDWNSEPMRAELSRKVMNA